MHPPIRTSAAPARIAALLLGVAFGLPAQTVPSTMNYQGRLTDNTPSQNPVSASVPMRFDIYDAAASGASLWNETDTVTVTAGVFSVQLGAASAIPPFIFSGGTQRWLQITLNPGTGAEQILLPRQALAANAYAAQAQKAALATNSTQLAGVADTGWQKALTAGCSGTQYLSAIAQNGAPTCSTPATSVPNPLSLSGNPANAVISATNTAAAGVSNGLYGESNSPSGYGVYGVNYGANGIGVYGRDGNGGSAIGVLGEATSGYGVYGKATASGGYGVYGTNTAGGYAGVFGGPVTVSGDASAGSFTTGGTANFGASTRQMVNLYGTSYGIGIQGYTQYFRTGGGFAWYLNGAHNDTQWNSGGGTTLLTLDSVGKLSMNPGSSNYAYLGLSNAGINTNGSYYGAYVRGATEGVDSVGGTYGVYGGGGTYGVYGNSSAGGYGLFGNSSGTGARGDGNYGVSGYGSNIGVYAHNTNFGHDAYLAAGCCAADLYGNVSISGTLSKSSGSFKIDHPLDPANKYLYHSFVESPDMKNLYDGVVTTDGRGEAVVELPDWFEALNGDYRYQLTVIGEFAQAIIARKIEHGRFTIRTSKPGVEVSWQVTGTRRDPYAEAHRIPVEEDKPEGERGHYIFPELYGKGEQDSIRAARHPVPPPSQDSSTNIPPPSAQPVK